ncbi:MAG: ABC transporter ATP-binding protein [Firmicutes bacterium]|jgi:ABC-type branched-subunit amino acid transport system ATPase component|nr:ABC transporter ATP-binding protein [Bacillota bacterium]
MLELKGVVAGYGGGDVLKGVDLVVEAGTITCIIGPNGAGKSTVLKVISGLLRPRRGKVLFEGEDISGWPPARVISRGIVQVAQDRSLFPQMTVRENVRLGGYTLRDRSLVERRLAEVEELFPIVRERAHDRAGNLSGGQQKLVEFARGLMLDPKVVLLDEPSMGLDPRTMRTVFESIRTMHAAGRTVLLVEQNARSGLNAAHRGVVMENGVVRLVAPAHDVLAHPEIGELYLGGATRPA